jgi:acyl carrier protein
MLERVRDCMVRAMKLDAKAAAGITEQTGAGQLPAWTSVNHLALILELEKTFSVRFDNNEIAALGSVAAILDRLAAKGVPSA